MTFSYILFVPNESQELLVSQTTTATLLNQILPQIQNGTSIKDLIGIMIKYENKFPFHLLAQYIPLLDEATSTYEKLTHRIMEEYNAIASAPMKEFAAQASKNKMFQKILFQLKKSNGNAALSLANLDQKSQNELLNDLFNNFK